MGSSSICAQFRLRNRPQLATEAVFTFGRHGAKPLRCLLHSVDGQRRGVNQFCLVPLWWEGRVPHRTFCERFGHEHRFGTSSLPVVCLLCVSRFALLFLGAIGRGASCGRDEQQHAHSFRSTDKPMSLTEKKQNNDKKAPADCGGSDGDKLALEQRGYVLKLAV